MELNKRIKLLHEILGQFSPLGSIMSDYEDVTFVNLTVTKREPGVLEYKVTYKPKGDLFKQVGAWDAVVVLKSQSQVINQVILKSIFGKSIEWVSTMDDVAEELSPTT
ncbi:hypothetical protein AVT69_gp347 [Pseudomonas phage PhiPA3]|uniref:Uncharacterized protein 349 n=1 Tax=Pseudomonas phage PhiPA3 TaxID=998086 RepID=F8SJI3_BPPA3|nr:hypothetical protein AVT69_gp347 [Pseudomonas phage PhiPA3]AEH03772.1 hypothetical protein [Pseudomonas phage PhiPA3]